MKRWSKSSESRRAAWSERAALKTALLEINEKDIRAILAVSAYELNRPGYYKDTMDDFAALAGRSEDVAGELLKRRLPPDQLRRVLQTVVERIELDPATHVFEIKYRLPLKRSRPKQPTITGVKLASPRDADLIPDAELVTYARLKRAA